VAKTYFTIAIIFFILGVGLATGIFYFAIYQPAVDNYKIAVGNFERQDEILRREYSNIVESNRRAEEQLISARSANSKLIENNRRTEAVFRELSSGIFGATEDLQGIIESVSSLIDTIGISGENE